MNKPLYGLLLGGFLGVFDGLSALVTTPEVRPQIVGIVIGATFKGLVAGVLIGWFARKVHSLTLGTVFGLGVGLALAWIIAYLNARQGRDYYWQIMLPGAVLGLIVGYATQRHVPKDEAPLARAASAPGR